MFFSAGTGFLGFGFFRLIFFGVYRDNLVWPNFWEELTELMYVAGVGFVLFIIRHSLLAKGKNYDPAGDVQEGKKITGRVS